ncbi:uncharacterized protein LOC109832271 [Asparagus officinalis]|uniref:uncharacterized protein LOC109832271 n=1 Tax=Asparagus officinalis TaxID=4686 RepID=UPI00098DE265|nr:uncharacterized protein LOC109832271 [Asparagus officinalis]
MTSSSSSLGSSKNRSGVNYQIDFDFNNLSCIRKWNEVAKRYGVKICSCRAECDYYTSMTDANSERRFYRCRNYKNGGCHVWEWFNDQLCNVASQLFPLLREGILNLRNNDILNDQLIERVENEMKECHADIAKTKEELRICQRESGAYLLEISNLKMDRTRCENLIKLQTNKLKLYEMVTMVCGVVMCLGFFIVNMRW